jgi:hypothetical protein
MAVTARGIRTALRRPQPPSAHPDPDLPEQRRMLARL